jgi:hypothetical protein
VTWHVIEAKTNPWAMGAKKMFADKCGEALSILFCRLMKTEIRPDRETMLPHWETCRSLGHDYCVTGG